MLLCKDAQNLPMASQMPPLFGKVYNLTRQDSEFSPFDPEKLLFPFNSSL
jgi:hypothetical protein